jgi:hypothetical protein
MILVAARYYSVAAKRHLVAAKRQPVAAKYYSADLQPDQRVMRVANGVANTPAGTLYPDHCPSRLGAS